MDCEKIGCSNIPSFAGIANYLTNEIGDKNTRYEFKSRKSKRYPEYTTYIFSFYKKDYRYRINFVVLNRRPEKGQVLMYIHLPTKLNEYGFTKYLVYNTNGYTIIRAGKEKDVFVYDPVKKYGFNQLMHFLKKSGVNGFLFEKMR